MLRVYDLLQRGPVIRLTDVHLHDPGALAEFVGRVLDVTGVLVGDQDAHAGFDASLGDREADSRGPARDDGEAAFAKDRFHGDLYFRGLACSESG